MIHDMRWQVTEAKFVFEGRTIKRMELLVLSTLKWRMQAVTACSFIDYFLHKLNDHGAPSMLTRSRSADLILSTAKGVITNFVTLFLPLIDRHMKLIKLGSKQFLNFENLVCRC
jgi:hypothetical protein